MHLLEVMVPCPAADRWASAALTPLGVANAACAAKESDYAHLSRHGYVVTGIVVDTCGGVAGPTLKWLGEVVRKHAPAQEWAARVEATVVRLQFASIAGMLTTTLEAMPYMLRPQPIDESVRAAALRPTTSAP